jgi:thioredoxin-like negative regulator of GroEL
MRYILGLMLFLSVAYGQVNDKNFKSEVNGGIVVAIFSSEWQEKDLDEKILKGVKGYQDCKIIRVKSEDAPKVVKKLRFRNFPSLALFYDGSKKETWKSDMDGELDISNKDIKGAIDDVLSEDVF